MIRQKSNEWEFIYIIFPVSLQHNFLKFFGKCNTPYDRMLDCMKKERIERRNNNAKAAQENQALVRERVRDDKTDYDELLKHYRQQSKQKSPN